MTTKSLSRRLQERYPMSEDVDARFDGLRSASDFTVAIVGAAIVEQHLEALIRQHLASRPPHLARRLFAPQGALNGFAGKIDVAHALRLIVDNVAEELHRLREIRNAFAHAPAPVTFATPEVATSLDEFGLLVAMRSVDPPPSETDGFSLPSDKGTYLLLARLLTYFVGPDAHHELGGRAP